MADETTDKGNDTFECSIRSNVRLSQDFHDWPEPERKASDAAIAKLLAYNPGAVVVSDTSECIDDTDPRFPDGDGHIGKFFVIRTVKLDRPGKSTADPGPAVPAAASHRLRAFEDEHVGKDAVRIGGRIERGSGSPYQNPKVLTPELSRQHAALEKLIETEQNLADAHGKLLQAEADHEAALAAAEPRPDAAE